MYQTRRNSRTMMTAGIVLCSMSIVCLLTQPLWANVTAAQLCTAMTGGPYPVTQGYLKYYKYNPTPDKLHAGIDYGVPEGINVRAILSGTVTFAGGSAGSVGVFDGYNTTFYLHLKNIKVRAGQAIQFGTIIGQVGKTGTTNAHLHIEVRRGRATSAVGTTTKGSTASNTYDPLSYF